MVDMVSETYGDNVLVADERSALNVRLEEAALNATAVSEQILYDGWLVRWAPGKPKRMRCINVIGLPLTPFESRLDFARRFYARRKMPLVFRLTSIGPDPDLDEQLEQAQFSAFGETQVMHCALERLGASHTALRFERVQSRAFAQTVGALRDSTTEEVNAHTVRLDAVRLEQIALLAWTPDGDCAGAALAVIDDDLLGIFDVVVNPAHRRRGFGRALAAQLAARAAALGAKSAYLQVETSNDAARSLYQALGFTDVYRYWYRCALEESAPTPDHRT